MKKVIQAKYDKSALWLFEGKNCEQPVVGVWYDQDFAGKDPKNPEEFCENFNKIGHGIQTRVVEK